ncbi:alanine racemase [Paraliobacillus ryukyuensis]|uniref:Alanine racemase n=1 Tax=Paraliobacillus ryukyuensis TaxID=200904 RepID=A0A366ED76_9BACI|nr:alanine racemase [Paraliobacillus ryukyuensis]RBO99699.1 alanine racemase [Paraliobacillus ryukyuensis]
MTEMSYRPTWIEVDLNAIDYNINQLKRRLSEHTEIFAVVKANGYGHGDVEVAKAALKAGASMLAVALLEEAIKLRHAGIEVPILVLGWVAPEYAPIAVKHDITLTFFQKEWVQSVKQLSFRGALTLHLKIDTGMGRIGVKTEDELTALLEELDDERLQLTGLFTHFATADEADLNYFQQQQQTWLSFQQLISSYRQDVMYHTGNSAASMRFPDKMFDAVRFGISMYGLYPSGVVKQEKPIELQPAMSLHSKLVHVKQLPPGSFVSYGATYTTKSDEWIGTVPIGYADGLARSLTGMDVLIDGKRMPIVGKICMDQCMIKLDQSYPIGTQVTFIGKQRNEEISMDEIADRLNTINYEVACMLTQRIRRTYVNQ